MCLITRQKRVKRLKEDLKVYKMFTSTIQAGKTYLRSPYIGFPYEEDTTYKTQLKRTSKAVVWFDDVVGDHYKLLLCNVSDIRKNFTAIKEGYHSAKTFPRLFMGYVAEDSVLIECTIPEGSLYYEDETDLIVSDSLYVPLLSSLLCMDYMGTPCFLGENGNK